MLSDEIKRAIASDCDLAARVMIAKAEMEAEMTETRPTYDDLVALLRECPPRQMISDQRFWDYRRRVEAMLARVDQSSGQPR